MGKDLRGTELHGLKIDSKGVKVLACQDGAGWVTMWSPNAGVRWQVSGDDRVVTQNVYVETGPASSASVWVGGMGATATVVEVLLILAGTRAVDPVTGQVLSGLTADLERPTASARFFPSFAPIDAEYPDGPVMRQSTPRVGSHTMTIPAVIPAGATVILGYPTAERAQLSVKAAATLVPEVAGGDPGAKVTMWIGPPSTLFSVDVSPLHHVLLTNPHAFAVQFSAIWRDHNSVKQT